MALGKRKGLRPLQPRVGVKKSGVYPGSGMPSGAQVAKGGANTAGSGRRQIQPVSPTAGSKVFGKKRPGVDPNVPARKKPAQGSDPLAAARKRVGGGANPAAGKRSFQPVGGASFKQNAAKPRVAESGASIGEKSAEWILNDRNRARKRNGLAPIGMEQAGLTPSVKPGVNIFDAEYAADRASGERELQDSLTEARARLAALQNGGFGLYNTELSRAKAENASHTYDTNAGLAARGIFSSGSRDVAHRELADAMAARELELNDSVGMNAANRLRGEITAAETSGMADLLARLAGEAAGRKGEEEAVPVFEGVAGKPVKSAAWLANDRKRALARQAKVAAAKKRKGR